MDEKEEIGKDIRKRILQHSLSFSRVPKNTKLRFLEIANDDDFCSDRGMALKYLIDFHDGIVVSGQEQLLDSIDELKQEMAVLKEGLHKEEEKKPSTRKMLGGKEIKNE